MNEELNESAVSPVPAIEAVPESEPATEKVAVVEPEPVPEPAVPAVPDPFGGNEKKVEFLGFNAQDSIAFFDDLDQKAIVAIDRALDNLKKTSEADGAIYMLREELKNLAVVKGHNATGMVRSAFNGALFTLLGKNPVADAVDIIQRESLHVRRVIVK